MFKEFLSKNYIERIYRPEIRDLDGLRCDKNERVKLWDEEFVNKVLSDIKPIDLATYPDLTSLYETISNFEELDSSQIMISSGLDGCIKTIFETYTKPGMFISLPGPTYGMYYVYSDCYDTKIKNINFDFNKFVLNRDQLYDSLKESKLLFLPNPNSPTEDNFSFEELELIAKKCLENDVLFALDEVYYGFGAETGKSLIKYYPNVVVMRSFSKAFGMPSIRFGYIMGQDKVLKRISQKRFSYETSNLQLSIVKKLIENYDLIDSYNDTIIDSRNKIKEDFERLGYRINANSGNFFLLEFKNELNKQTICKLLDENKIYIKNNLSTREDIVENGKALNKFGLISIGPYDLMKPLIKIFETIQQQT